MKLVLLFAMWVPIASAAVLISPRFGNHMVLQRDKPVPVSGTASVNEKVTVTFHGQTKTTTSDAAGSWQLMLDAMPATSSGKNLTATEAGANSVTLTDIVIGDVWLCGGQSNMAFTLGDCDRRGDIERADYPVMRQFRAPLAISDHPLPPTGGDWTVCRPSTAAAFSAVAFYFGRKICEDQKSAIPIGLYVASVGGTKIDPWLAPEGATDIPALAPLYTQDILPWGPFSLFNGMVHSHAPLPAKGLIWYQGENGEMSVQSPDSYYLKMKALAQGYRRMLGVEDFAFYFVQLAAWGKPPADATPVLFSGGWDADTRLQQANAMALPHAGMASALDIGDAADMHPRDKLDVGERLALWALKNDYGKPATVASGPVLKDASRSGGSVVCTFSHSGSGLMAGSKTPYQPTRATPGEPLRSFSIAAASGAWHPATAVIRGDTVVLSSPAVPRPRRVAYACWQNPAGCNLYNREGLPASPFHVDDVEAKFTITARAGAGGKISPAVATGYLKRQTALYTITPDTGFHIAGVTVDGVPLGAVASHTFDPLDADHRIAATFTRKAPEFTITATTAPGGRIVPEGEVKVAAGNARTFSATSGPGAIVTLAVDGKPLGRRASHTFADVRENHTITASFTFPIEARAGYGGTITPAGTTVVAHGGRQTYRIVPQDGFSVSKVTVDGVAVGKDGSHTFADVTAGHGITATFVGAGAVGSVPRADKIFCSFLTDTLPASGKISSWPSHLPAGKTLAAQGSPEVEVIDGRRFVRNAGTDSDALDLGTIPAAIPCSGATIVVVAKPVRTGTDPGWTSLVDVFYDRLVLGIMNGSGKVVVRRNGSLDTSTATIPDGQTTILSLVVRQDGSYMVHANGVEVMQRPGTGDLTALVPGAAGGFANRVTFGRNWPDGWTTFNGCYGDCFVYTTALTDPERRELETFLVNRLTAAGRSR